MGCIRCLSGAVIHWLTLSCSASATVHVPAHRRPQGADDAAGRYGDEAHAAAWQHASLRSPSTSWTAVSRAAWYASHPSVHFCDRFYLQK